MTNNNNHIYKFNTDDEKNIIYSQPYNENTCYIKNPYKENTCYIKIHDTTLKKSVLDNSIIFIIALYLLSCFVYY